ncbi:hypothetical protein HK096_003378, partial [Nowakowskiella sp. JEL0078]
MGFKKDKVLVKNVKLAPPLLGVKVLNFEKSAEGKTFYTIEVLPSVPLVSPDVTMVPLSGRSYKIKRRFEDFQFFHALLLEKLKKEYGDPLSRTSIADVIPELPRKRLFSSNSNNEDILSGLMEYVRKLFLLPKVVYKSRLLSEFFGMWQDDYEISENILIYKAVSSILVNSKPEAQLKMQDISLDEEWMHPVAQQRLSLLTFTGYDFLVETEVMKVKPNTLRKSKLNEVAPLPPQTRSEQQKETRKVTRNEQNKLNKSVPKSQSSRDSILIKENARKFVEEILSIESSPFSSFSERIDFGSFSSPTTSFQPTIASNLSATTLSLAKPKTREMATSVSETLLMAQSPASFRAIQSSIKLDMNLASNIQSSPLNTSPTTSMFSVSDEDEAIVNSNSNQLLVLDNDYRSDLNRSRSTDSIGPKYAERNSSLRKSALQHSKSFVSSPQSIETQSLDRVSPRQKSASEEKTEPIPWNLRNFTISRTPQTTISPKQLGVVETQKSSEVTSKAAITPLDFTSVGNDIYKRAVGLFAPVSPSEASALSVIPPWQANEMSFRGRDEVLDKKGLKRGKSIEIVGRPPSSDISDKWDADLERQRHFKLTENSQRRSGVFAIAAVGGKPSFVRGTNKPNKNRDSVYSVSPFEDGYQSYVQDSRRRSKVYTRSHTLGHGTKKDVEARFLQCKCIVDGEMTFLISFSRNIGFESLLHKISARLLSVIDEDGDIYRKVESIEFKDGDGHLVRICDEEDWGICLAETSYLSHLTLFVASFKVTAENASVLDEDERSNYPRRLSVSPQARPKEFYEKIESPSKTIMGLNFKRISSDGPKSAPTSSKQSIPSPITYNQRSFTPPIPQRKKSLLLKNTRNRTTPLTVRSQTMHVKGARSYDSNSTSDSYHDVREDRSDLHLTYTHVHKGINGNVYADVKTSPKFRRDDVRMYYGENPVLRKKSVDKAGGRGNYSDDERDVPAIVVEHEQ